MDENHLQELIKIGQVLRRLRLDADIGQDELAMHTGLSRKTIQNAEAGNNYSMETLIKILRGLNSTHYLDAFLSAAVRIDLEDQNALADTGLADLRNESVREFTTVVSSDSKSKQRRQRASSRIAP